MKAREGYVFSDERSKKWVARFSPFVNATTRKNFTRSRATRREALNALREMIQQYDQPYGISKKVTLRRCARFIDRAHFDPTRAIK
jgi:hypothetical protein